MKGEQELQSLLQEVVSRPVHDVADADMAAEAAGLLRDLIVVRGRAEELLRRARAAPERGRAEEAAPPYEARGLAGATLHEAARRVLTAAGTPLHVQDLGARIKAGGWRHPRAEGARSDLINFQLAARLPRHPNVFRRVAPNTFGLAEWGATPAGRRPKPRLKATKGRGAPLARRMSDEPDLIFEDEPKWRSS